MSKTVPITSTSQFKEILETSKVVVADFYADWCGPCKQVAPLFEQFSMKWSQPKKITFVKVDTQKQQELANEYNVTALPSFLIFRNNRYVNTIRGANPTELLASIKKLMGDLPADKAADKDGGGFGEASSSSNSDSGWLGLDFSRSYSNVTAEVDPRGLDLLNFNSDLGTASTLFDESKPSALASDKGKGKTDASGAEGESKNGKDWIESDTDEQLMLFVPFKSKLKIQSLQITSLPPKRSEEDNDDEIPMRPRTIKLYSNEPHVLGFEAAEDIPATQEITLEPRDWDEGTGTARIDLRFVKFQNVTSLVLFVFDGDGEGEKVRVDRLRIIGETGEKREMGKLEKIGDLPGE